MYVTQTSGVDQGLRRYMTSIYNLMFLGLLVSAGTAVLGESLGLVQLFKSTPILFYITLFSPLGLVLAMSIGGDRMKLSTLHLLYWSFVVIEGLVLSVILAAYTSGSIITALVAAAVGFLGCSLYGYVTRRDLGPIGTVMVFALFGLIGLMILNIFIPSTGLNLFIGIAGILVFGILTAWDTQKLKLAYYAGMGSDQMGRLVVMGALDLYLDFLNMFLFILRLMGVKSDD
jgi:FtsH-binding integral membrane protein